MPDLTFLFSFVIKISSRKMGKTILLLSKEKRLFSFLKSTYPDSKVIIADPNCTPFLNLSPDYIFHLCNYDCRNLRCWNIFALSRFFQESNFFIIRHAMTKMNNNCPNFIIQSLSNHDKSMTVSQIKKNLSICNRSNLKAILIEEFIISNHGKLNKLKELSKDLGLSYFYLSKLFRKYADINLKSFVDTINLCYCLWQRVAISWPLKSIALDNGYSPISFSIKFKKRFGSSPSEARSKSLRIIIEEMSRPKL